MANWVPYKIPNVSEDYTYLSNLIASRQCSINCNDNKNTAYLSIENINIEEKFFQININFNGENITTYIDLNSLKNWLLDSVNLNIDAIPAKYFLIALLERTLKPFRSYLSSMGTTYSITEINNSAPESGKDLLCLNVSSMNARNIKSMMKIFVAKKHNPWIIEKITKIPFKDSNIYSFLMLKCYFRKWELAVPYMELLSLNLGDIVLLDVAASDDKSVSDVKIFIENIELGSGKLDDNQVTVESVNEANAVQEQAAPPDDAIIDDDNEQDNTDDETDDITKQEETETEAEAETTEAEDESDEDVDDT